MPLSRTSNPRTEKSVSDKTWDQLFIEMTRLVASKSKDTSTKCGCVIVGPDNEVRTTGYNGLPRGVEYKQERTEVRPEKYFWFEHSERNAIYNAARIGVSLKDCRAYVTGPPCADCARGLIQAGIKEVVIPSDHSKCAVRNKDRWGDSCDRAQEMFKEAGVGFRMVEGM
jgi:dCMP deaminase